MNPLIIIVIAQLLFTVSDLIGRHFMVARGFSTESFLSLWFLGYFALRNVAMFGQLYVFSKIELGHTMALFGAVSIILANVLGLLFLKEVLAPSAYVGITLAIVAFFVLSLRV